MTRLRVFEGNACIKIRRVTEGGRLVPLLPGLGGGTWWLRTTSQAVRTMGFSGIRSSEGRRRSTILIAMKARGKKLKRRRGPSMSFGELVQKLWQPDSEALGSKVAMKKQRKPAAKGKRPRSS
jgi:hypothetical protein